jgi:hypothetical protein
MKSTLIGVNGVKVEFILVNNTNNTRKILDPLLVSQTCMIKPKKHLTLLSPLNLILLSKSFIYRWKISFCANQIFPKITVQLTASMESCCWTTLRPSHQKKHHQVQQFLDNLRYLQCPKLQAAVQTTLLAQLEKVLTLKMFTKRFIFCWKDIKLY